MMAAIKTKKIVYFLNDWKHECMNSMKQLLKQHYTLNINIYTATMQEISWGGDVILWKYFTLANIYKGLKLGGRVAIFSPALQGHKSSLRNDLRACRLPDESIDSNIIHFITLASFIIMLSLWKIRKLLRYEESILDYAWNASEEPHSSRVLLCNQCSL